MAAPGSRAGGVMMPDLANIAPAPLVRHYTSVAPAPNGQFAASCLCGWPGPSRASAAEACTDANAHEGGTS